MSTSQSNQTKAQRRDAARAEALSLQKKQQAREKTFRVATLSVLGGLVVLLGVAIWFIMQESGKSTMEKVSAVPAGVIEETGIPVGASGAAGTQNEGAERLDVYLDYMCPVCGQFESINGASIDQMREDGDITLVVHPVSILDRLSQGTDYSSRSAAAAAWVADRAPEAFAEYNDLLFANQPAENSPGLTDAQLADLAEQAGAPADVAEGITDGEADDTFRDWVTAATEVATSDPDLMNPETGSFGTPTVLVGGERFADWGTVGSLTTAITGESGN